MSSQQYVKYTLDAINSVKRRAKKAMEDGDMPAYSKLMGDLYALEVCLVYESQKLVEALDKKDAEAA